LYFVSQVQPLTLATRVIAFSVLLQTFLFITLGTIADYGAWRYRMWLSATLIGGLLTMSIMLISKYQDYQALGIIVLVSNACWGLSNVFYNSYIPVLVDTHEEVIESPNDFALRDEISSFISSAGSLCGYVSGLTLVLIVLGLLVLIPGDDINAKYRLCIFLAGLWWIVWSAWPFARLRTHTELSRSPGPSEIVIFSGWISFFKKIVEVRQYPETFRFLIAWFVYSDTYNTVAAMGILILQDRLCMAGIDMGILLIIVLICAGFGNFFSWSFKEYFRLTSKFMIASCLSVYLFIAFLMTLGA
jgi:UMF1 family MFS transporter